MRTRVKELSLDASAALNRLADAREILEGWGRDAAVARELGVTSKRISTWRDRNTLDHDLIALKCREWGLSMSWIYFGDGPRLVTPLPPPPDPFDKMKRLVEELNKEMEEFAKGKESTPAADSGVDDQPA